MSHCFEISWLVTSFCKPGISKILQYIVLAFTLKPPLTILVRSNVERPSNFYPFSGPDAIAEVRLTLFTALEEPVGFIAFVVIIVFLSCNPEVLGLISDVREETNQLF